MKPTETSAKGQTPGKWTVSGIPGDNYVMAEHRQIACVRGWYGITPEEHAANLALIASAPTLLAMCQNALEALEGISESNACMSEFERACIPSLRAVIAQAQGTK